MTFVDDLAMRGMTNVVSCGTLTMYCVHEGMACTTNNTNDCIDDSVVIANEVITNPDDCRVPVHMGCFCKPPPETVLNVTVIKSGTVYPLQGNPVISTCNILGTFCTSHICVYTQKLT